MFSRAILVAVTWVCLTCASGAQTLDFPALAGQVVDEAQVLDPSARAALGEALAALEDNTSDQVVVVTLKWLRGTSIEDYGYRLGRRWQISRQLASCIQHRIAWSRA